MRWVTALTLLLHIGSAVLAQSGSVPQVEAARTDAIESIKRQIIASHITSDLTVADLLDRIGGVPELDRTLSGAEELGDPRWLGTEAVQVRLSIDGSRVAKMLLKLVQTHPKQSPVSPESLQRQLKWWSDRIFSATGTSMGPGDISRLRPPLSDRAWWNVADADRRRALIAARDNAIDRVVQSLDPVTLGEGKTLGQALSDPTVRQAVRKWLSNQPVKDVQFNDDLTVRLTLADLDFGFWPILKSALANQHSVPLPTTDAEWNRLHDQVSARLTNPSGMGVVEPPAQVGAGTPAVALPAEPPAWSKEQAESEATSPQDGSPLHTSRRAEALAMEKLRDQINQLPLSPGMTVGAAAGKDPRIEQAIAKCLSRARPSKVNYGSNGDVTVHVVLRLADLWSLMSGQE